MSEPAAAKCDCCKIQRVMIAMHRKDLPYTAENVKDPIDEGKIDSMTNGLPPDPPKKNFYKKPWDMVPLGLKLKRDRIKPAGDKADQSPYTSSHDYPTRTYDDDEALACMDVDIKIENCDLETAIMQVVDKSEGEEVIFEDDLSKPIPRPAHKNGTPNYLSCKDSPHHWQWDGYDKNGLFDSQYLRKAKQLYLRLDYTCKCPNSGSPESHRVEAKLSFKTASKDGEWLDLKIADKDKVREGTLLEIKVEPESHYLPHLPGWVPNTDISSPIPQSATITRIPGDVGLYSKAPEVPAAYDPKIITMTMRVQFTAPSKNKEVRQIKYGTIKTDDTDLAVELGRLNNHPDGDKFFDQGTEDVSIDQYKIMCDGVRAAGPPPDFKALEAYAAKGLASTWSRPGHTRYIEANPSSPSKYEKYELSVDVEMTDDNGETKSGMPVFKNKMYLYPVVVPAKIRSFVIGEGIRAEAHLCYNFGMIHGWPKVFPGYKNTNGLYDVISLDSETMDFKRTVGHEFGHLMLNLIYNSNYSNLHKYSSFSNQSTHTYLACTGDFTGLDDVERDLMKYSFGRYYASTIASENDVRGLIALASLRATLGPSTQIP